MTEAEWLACADPRPMLEFLRGTASDRKRRLFAVACCRRISPEGEQEESRRAVEVAERFADGLATNAERRASVKSMEQLADPGPAYYGLRQDAFFAAAKCSHHMAMLRVKVMGIPHSRDVPGLRAPSSNPDWWREYGAERAAQTALINDIFGNPFRPVAFSPDWRTDTALSLARQMYESRDFSAMPILADALQDAGCDSDDILNHCRDAAQVHVRGCWVVDLVLGKE